MPDPAQHPLENQPPSSGNHSNAVVLNPRDLSEIRQLEIGLRLENEKKVAAQIASAKKSLIYNLFMSTLITLTTIASFMLPCPGNFYFVAFFPTAEKGLISVLTLMANFSTVRSVLLQYLNICK